MIPRFKTEDYLAIEEDIFTVCIPVAWIPHIEGELRDEDNVYRYKWFDLFGFKLFLKREFLCRWDEYEL